MNKVNYHGIDDNGNHTMTLIGDDQEHRMNLMAASEALYLALKALANRFLTAAIMAGLTEEHIKGELEQANEVLSKIKEWE